MDGLCGPGCSVHARRLVAALEAEAARVWEDEGRVGDDH
jgi:hypothetical protein